MVETSRDDDLFRTFCARPGEETLLALLRGNQDRIYNICFQILRHAQDAEDASQEVLLELTEGCSRIRDLRAFKSWLYRVALHTALNHKKARFARGTLARRRAAMPTPEGVSIPHEAGTEVIEAIARLDDESRCLILEHYFEKTTLEDLAKKEGLSVAGIWKRIDRAKGMLRRALIGVGFSVTASSLSHALETVAPVSAPAGLIGGAVMSKAALVAAGGFAVASKSVISGTAVALAFTLLTVGAGGGYWVGSKRGPERAEISASGRGSSNPITKPHVADPGPQDRTAAAATSETIPSSERASTPIEDMPPTKQGPVKFASATRSGGWKEFYEHANALGISFREMRSLVYMRLERELKLTEEEYSSLHTLVREEEEAVSTHVYAKYGDYEKLWAMMESSSSNKSVIIADIMSIRNTVRTTFNPRFSSTFSQDQVKAINERLRGENVLFHGESEGQNMKHTIRTLPGYME